MVRGVLQQLVAGVSELICTIIMLKLWRLYCMEWNFQTISHESHWVGTGYAASAKALTVTMNPNWHSRKIPHYFTFGETLPTVWHMKLFTQNSTSCKRRHLTCFIFQHTRFIMKGYWGKLSFWWLADRDWYSCWWDHIARTCPVPPGIHPWWALQPGSKGMTGKTNPTNFC